MLSQSSYDKLVQVIVDRQESINTYVLGVIGSRIKEVGQLLPSDVYKLEILLKTGSDVRKINEELARISALQVKEISKLIELIARDIYKSVKPYYDYRHKPYIPFEKNTQLQRVVEAIRRQTSDSYINISKAQAFMLRDKKNPKIFIPTPPALAYQKVVDEAIQATQMGVIDYHSAIRKTVEELADSGIKAVTYETESGKMHAQRADSAVRRNVLDGVRAINQGVQDITGEQFGADGKEITVHSYSAPDHEPIQGHQFSLEEYEKLQNEKSAKDYFGITFPAMKRAIGVLNCRHFTYSVILGVMKPNYTLEQLEKFKQDNAKGYTTKAGKHYTMYQCTQMQRKYELAIRKEKEKWVIADRSGDAALKAKAQSRISTLLAQYQSFSRGCGLKPKYNKTEVAGYKTKK